MINITKRLLFPFSSIIIPVFFLSFNVLYDQKAYAEEWKPCTTQYTIMSMLTESLFVNTETNNNETNYSKIDYSKTCNNKTSNNKPKMEGKPYSKFEVHPAKTPYQVNK